MSAARVYLTNIYRTSQDNPTINRVRENILTHLRGELSVGRGHNNQKPNKEIQGSLCS